MNTVVNIIKQRAFVLDIHIRCKQKTWKLYFYTHSLIHLLMCTNFNESKTILNHRKLWGNVWRHAGGRTSIIILFLQSFSVSSICQLRRELYSYTCLKLPSNWNMIDSHMPYAADLSSDIDLLAKYRKCVPYEDLLCYYQAFSDKYYSFGTRHLVNHRSLSLVGCVYTTDQL
jgi:hypothetical protein